jgi:protein TonB
MGLSGTATLFVEIDPDGIARNITVTRRLGMGLDEEAIAAVEKWHFQPGMKDGQPVPVRATIEVNFRLL